MSDIRNDLDLYVEMITEQGETIIVGEVPAYCDMESTFLVNTDKPVNKVNRTCIDTVLVFISKVVG